MAAAGSRDYVPDRGDIVWLTFTRQAGREQSGRRRPLHRLQFLLVDQQRLGA